MVKNAYSVDVAALAFLRSTIIADSGLTDAFERAMRDGFVYAQGRYPTSKVTLRLDTRERESLIDHLVTLLSDIGLQSDSEPNATGLRIEGLIDVFTDA